MCSKIEEATNSYNVDVFFKFLADIRENTSFIKLNLTYHVIS